MLGVWKCSYAVIGNINKNLKKERKGEKRKTIYG